MDRQCWMDSFRYSQMGNMDKNVNGRNPLEAQ